ncbi:MAG TPA: hypothetical protein VFO34_11810, partial [Candidatus Acidoferrales bacterium]|nr:hypothetical protein [Candidatus Acidoferrales bacterium]
MPDWKQYVRKRLPELRVSPAREREIVEELAQQLEQRFADELARGSSARAAGEAAKAQFADWANLAAEIRRAERPLAEQATQRMPESVRSAISEDGVRSR